MRGLTFEVWAWARFAMNSWAAAGMLRSCVATRTQEDGLPGRLGRALGEGGVGDGAG
ncbi:hypothetical protein [Streptomyces sp. KL116D]|uniref:hypothetical protein n=1 Tax=Streptomyces sp. KL116D TaxID=3045152 RepID=UPI0035585D81